MPAITDALAEVCTAATSIAPARPAHAPPSAHASTTRRSVARPTRRAARALPPTTRSEKPCAVKLQPGAEQHARGDADHQAPVHVAEERVGRDRADLQRRVQRPRRRLVEAGRIAHRAFDAVLEQRDRDVAQQQAGDGLVDAPPLPQHARQRHPQRRQQRARRQHHRAAEHAARQRASTYGSAAQPSAPSASAPSPPITVSPACAGSATASAVSISGAARCSVFCHENASPNAPRNSSVQTSSGLWPPNQQNTPNSSSAAASAITGSSRPSAEACQLRGVRIACSRRQTLPMTPSTR